MRVNRKLLRWYRLGPMAWAVMPWVGLCLLLEAIGRRLRRKSKRRRVFKGPMLDGSSPHEVVTKTIQARRLFNHELTAHCLPTTTTLTLRPIPEGAKPRPKKKRRSRGRIATRSRKSARR